MAIWCVPGAPLANGAGWRIWYSNTGLNDFTPRKVKVSWGLLPVKFDQVTRHLMTPRGLSRRIAVVDVKLQQPLPGAAYHVTIPELGRTFVWSTRPARICDDGTSFILSSCFWQNDDGGHFRAAIDSVLKYEKPRPAFKLLVGDQIYLDFPFSLNPLAKPAALTAQRYEQYWGDASYRDALLSTPNFLMCDDHEYWNDYPEKQIHLARTRGSDRNEFADLADEYYTTFQRELIDSDQRWYEFDITPASFFVTDTRSEREFFKTDGTAHFMTEPQWLALETWQRKLTGPGFLVLGQPLFQEDGNWKDHSYSNFKYDYDRLLNIIERSLRGENDEGIRHDIVILSGDIHTGRYAWASVPIVGQSGVQVHELIASPSSRIGPFKSEPKPVRPPARIPPSDTGRVRWKVSSPTWSRAYFETVENNIGVLRMYKSEKHDFKLRVEFVTYLVRPHRIPAWKIFARQPQADFSNQDELRLDTTELHLL